MRIRRQSAAIDTTSAADTTAGKTCPPPTVPCLLNQSPWDVATFSPDSTLQGFLVVPSPRKEDSKEAAHLKAAVKSMLAMAGGGNKKHGKLKQRRHIHPISMSNPSAAKLAPATLLMLSSGRQSGNEAVKFNAGINNTSALAGETDEKGDAFRINGVQPNHRHPIFKFGAPSTEALPAALLEGKKRALWGKGRRHGTEVKDVVAALPASNSKLYRRTGLATAKKPRRKAAEKPSGGDYYYYSGFGPRWRSSKRRLGQETETEPEQPEAAPASPQLPALIKTEPAEEREAPAPAPAEEEREAPAPAKVRKPMKKRSIMSFI